MFKRHHHLCIFTMLFNCEGPPKLSWNSLHLSIRGWTHLRYVVEKTAEYLAIYCGLAGSLTYC